MTVQEAIDLIKQVPLYRYECELQKGRQSDLFKALNKAIDSMEKQIQKKPKSIRDDWIDTDMWVGCICGAMQLIDTETHKQIYCWKCGQLLSLEEGGTSE